MQLLTVDYRCGAIYDGFKKPSSIFNNISFVITSYALIRGIKTIPLEFVFSTSVDVLKLNTFTRRSTTLFRLTQPTIAEYTNTTLKSHHYVMAQRDPHENKERHSSLQSVTSDPIAKNTIPVTSTMNVLWSALAASPSIIASRKPLFKYVRGSALAIG